MFCVLHTYIPVDYAYVVEKAEMGMGARHTSASQYRYRTVPTNETNVHARRNALTRCTQEIPASNNRASADRSTRLRLASEPGRSRVPQQVEWQAWFP